jgi:hypothetical protein
MSVRHSERGQALVLIVLSIFVIFGFAALAVDMGRVYSERRRAQSAADGAALAAAYTGVNTADDPVAEGEQNAANNGFNNDGETNTVTVNYPPASGPYAGDWDYYQVIIWQHFNPVFSQFVFTNNQEITTEAVAHAVHGGSISAGNAVHSLSTQSDSLEMDGATGINIVGGNMYSNGGGIKHGKAGIVRVSGGGILIATDGGWTCTGCKPETVKPAANDDTVDILDVPEVPEPYCPKLEDGDETHYDVHYYVHDGINSSMVLAPGIHCVYNGISLTGGDVVSGTNVLIVMKSGGIKIKGNARIDLSRPDSIIDRNGYEYGGMLFYIPAGNDSDIALGGTADSWFSGTVYGPSATCDLGGTSDTKAIHTQVICYNIKFHGTVGVDVLYQDDMNYRRPTIIELSQ